MSLSSTRRTGQPPVAIEPRRLLHAKYAYTTRRVLREDIATLLPAARRPKAGDLVLARVTEIGQHEHLELPNGRRATLFPGDEIVVSFGNRYAPDQFEAVVPDGLGPCHLVAAGGLAARMLHKHARMRNPTAITPIGLLGDRVGRRINLARYGLPRLRPDALPTRPATVLIAGTSMSSGKTTVISGLARGFITLGARVAAAKVTGTGAGGDHWHMIDAGADPVLDFVDVGVASTYRLPSAEVDEVVGALVAHLVRAPVDIVLFEVSDGLLEPETARLLMSPRFRSFVDAVVFTAVDALGAAAGVSWLRDHGLPVIGLSGLLTSSPLATREARAAAEIPIYRTETLVEPAVAAAIRECVVVRAAARRASAPGPDGSTRIASAS